MLDRSSQGSELDKMKDILPDANILDKFLQDVKQEPNVENIVSDKVTPNTVEPHVERYVEPRIIVQPPPDLTRQTAKSEIEAFPVPIVRQSDIGNSIPTNTNQSVTGNSIQPTTNVSAVTLNPSATMFVPQNENTENYSGQYPKLRISLSQ